MQFFEFMSFESTPVLESERFNKSNDSIEKIICHSVSDMFALSYFHIWALFYRLPMNL